MATPLTLLTDPFVQRPQPDVTEVAWFTEFAGDAHYVLLGDGVAGLSETELGEVVSRNSWEAGWLTSADTVRLTRTAEDTASRLPVDRKPTAGITDREVYRHHAAIPVRPGGQERYRVISMSGSALVASAAFVVRGPRRAGEPVVVMLTSDHQLLPNVAANIEFAARTIASQLGPIDAVFMPGDFVNVPDRASEWFDDLRGSAFFPVMQGHGAATAADGTLYRGAPILQCAPVYPAIGNHEVQGRRSGHTSLDESFHDAVPRAVAEPGYPGSAAHEDADGDDAVRLRWLEENSFSVTTYEEIFSPPRSKPGGTRYYATTVGDIRLISLFVTRVWRTDAAEPDPAVRSSSTRFQEAREHLADRSRQGHGTFIFEPVHAGSEQYEWLCEELSSQAFRSARYSVVMLHEGPHSLGEHVVPAFTSPRRVEERDSRGALVGIRYDYPAGDNVLLQDLVPLLEEAGVDLVYSGHNHMWNRFTSPAGVHYLEGSNTGNSFGAYTTTSGRRRAVPPPPWRREDTRAQGNPGGLAAVVPTVQPRRDEAGRPLPYIADDELVVFQALHTATGTVTSWYVDLRDTSTGPVKFDEFRLQDP